MERHLRMATVPAKKTVSDGIQAVQSRLKPAGDGHPRLFIFRDCLIERDEALSAAGKPASTAEEMNSYVWAVKPGGAGDLKEQPVKENDHGVDAMRYLVAAVDLVGTATIRSPATRRRATPGVTSRYGRSIGRRSR